MKIIDGNGRLLGKVNVIDSLVIIFFFFLMPAIYFGYKIFHKKPETPAPVIKNVEVPKKEFIETELSFIFKKIDPQVISLISVGDKEISMDNGILGEILSLGEVVPYRYEVVVGSAKKVIVDSVSKDVPVTLRVKAEVKQNNLYYKDGQITDSGPIDFVTDKYKLEAFYVPNLIENNNRVENVSDSIEIIQQKQKEMEYAVSKLQNKIDFLENRIGPVENRIGSVEDRIASMAAIVVPEETKKSGKKK